MLDCKQAEPTNMHYGGKYGLNSKKVTETLDLVEEGIENAKKMVTNYYQIYYIVKYNDLLEKKEFWLEGLNNVKVNPLMMEYVQDHENAWNEKPSWYHEKERALSIDSFIGQMKLRWRKRHEKKDN